MIFFSLTTVETSLDIPDTGQIIISNKYAQPDKDTVLWMFTYHPRVFIWENNDCIQEA